MSDLQTLLCSKVPRGPVYVVCICVVNEWLLPPIRSMSRLAATLRFFSARPYPRRLRPRAPDPPSSERMAAEAAHGLRINWMSMAAEGRRRPPIAVYLVHADTKALSLDVLCVCNFMWTKSGRIEITVPKRLMGFIIDPSSPSSHSHFSRAGKTWWFKMRDGFPRNHATQFHANHVSFSWFPYLWTTVSCF